MSSVLAPRRFLRLLASDAQNVTRDPILFVALSISVVPVILIYFFGAQIEAGGAAIGFAGLARIAGAFALVLPAFLVGWVTGFLLLEDRDDGPLMAMEITPIGKGGFLLSKNSYKDFELRIEFWADPAANSGIYMRCSDPKNLNDKSCYEANIFDERPDQTYATGGIVHRGRVLAPQKAGGKWNTYEITARGTRMTVVLNGVKTAEIDSVQSPSGPIALQFGNQPKKPGGAIKFRKVQIRPL